VLFTVSVTTATGGLGSSGTGKGACALVLGCGSGGRVTSGKDDVTTNGFIDGTSNEAVESDRVLSGGVTVGAVTAEVTSGAGGWLADGAP
jgi:hypothetical protein